MHFTGRWPDGRTLTETQRKETMEAVLLWGQFHLPAEERVGFIDKGAKKRVIPVTTLFHSSGNKRD